MRHVRWIHVRGSRIAGRERVAALTLDLVLALALGRARRYEEQGRENDGRDPFAHGRVKAHLMDFLDDGGRYGLWRRTDHLSRCPRR